MNPNEKLQGAYQRTIKGLTKRPELGRITRSITARITEGVACELEGDGFRFTADMPEITGGSETGPVPSTLLEGAIASCLAIGVRMAFAARDLAVERIEVDVTADFDVCGWYGVSDIPPGFVGPLRYHVRVESPADPAVVEQILANAEAHSPLLDILTRPMQVERRLTVNGSAAGGGTDGSGTANSGAAGDHPDGD